MRLLVVENDSAMVLTLYRALASLYKVDMTTSSEGALRKLAEETYDILILDPRPGGMNINQVCKKIRTIGVTTPILIIIGQSKDLNSITLPGDDAHDYLAWPFTSHELHARLQHLASKAQSGVSTYPCLISGDLVLNLITRSVTWNEVPIRLRRKEIAILECLMRNAGQIVSRNTLAHHAWNNSGDITTNTVDVHIKYLRDKIDRQFSTSLIQTVHGLGYRMENAKPVSLYR